MVMHLISSPAVTTQDAPSPLNVSRTSGGRTAGLLCTWDGEGIALGDGEGIALGKVRAMQMGWWEWGQKNGDAGECIPIDIYMRLGSDYQRL